MKKLVKQNPDILFIIKSHPADNLMVPLEVAGFENEHNLRIVHDDFPIFELIANSDFWLSFASSTTLEAWLMGKPCLSFGTRKEILEHTYVSTGGLLSEDADQIQCYIDEYFSTGKIVDFENKADIRRRLAHDLIGFDDGLNHVRFLSFLRPLIEGAPGQKGRWDLGWIEKAKLYVKHLRALAAKRKKTWPLLRQHAKIYEMFNLDKLNEIKKCRYPQLDAFYAEHSDRIEHLYRSYADEWNRSH